MSLRLLTTLSAFALFLTIALTACGPRSVEDSSAGASPAPQVDAHEDHHGDPVALGRVDFGAESYLVTREGEAKPGEESAIALTPLQDGPWPGLYLWVEDAEGEQVCIPTAGDPEDGGLHFHFVPYPGSSPADLVIRRREGDKDERQRMSLEIGAAPQQDGVLVALSGGTWAELKLHDDVGDLELWLYRDSQGAEPADFPLDCGVELRFQEPQVRTLRLAPRDSTQNLDESGQSQIRVSRTNYFVFPGSTGADASWLSGLDFHGILSIHLIAESAQDSPLFALHPHSHAEPH